MSDGLLNQRLTMSWLDSGLEAPGRIDSSLDKGDIRPGVLEEDSEDPAS